MFILAFVDDDVLTGFRHGKQGSDVSLTNLIIFFVNVGRLDSDWDMRAWHNEVD